MRGNKGPVIHQLKLTPTISGVEEAEADHPTTTNGHRHINRNHHMKEGGFLTSDVPFGCLVKSMDPSSE